MHVYACIIMKYMIVSSVQHSYVDGSFILA